MTSAGALVFSAATLGIFACAAIRMNNRNDTSIGPIATSIALMADGCWLGDDGMSNLQPTDRARLQALADDYEAGTAKAIASGYEEFGPIWQHDRELIIKAMRAYASDHAPTVNGCDDASEPTQEEIEGVACVFADVHDDPTARASAYIMTKKLKRVFAAPTVRPADAGERIHALAIDLTLKGWCANENEINRLTKEAERKLLDFACDEIRRHMDRTGVSLGGGLLDAAQAVIDRWETPAWKDAPATAGYINALKTAVQRSAASSDNAPTSATHASEWTPEIDKRVLLYVVHDQAQWEPDEELRMRNWEGWHVGYWTDFNGGGWVWNGLCGHVTHVAPLLAPPSDPRNDRQTGVPQS